MLIDIFSSFDIFEFNGISCISSNIIIVISLLIIRFIYRNIWTKKNHLLILINKPKSIIFNQLKSTNIPKISGIINLITLLFLIIIIINIMGLTPISFRIRSHLIFTVRIGLPIWIIIIFSRIIYNKKQFIAQLLPDGAPIWLNPFLVLIETIRIIVRPITLSVRLAANIRAGHIVLSLIGIYASRAINNSILSSSLLISLSIGYIIFELAICLIQAYIFCLLLSLYSDDHTSN